MQSYLWISVHLSAHAEIAFLFSQKCEKEFYPENYLGSNIMSSRDVV